MRKVIVFRNQLLPPSETFVKEQALALIGWHPILAGYRLLANGLDLDGLDVQLLPGMNSGRVRRWRTKLQRLRGKPHKPTVEALKRIGADLLHAHFGTDATDIWPSARAAGLPMVATLHGYDINIYREWWESGKGSLRRRVYPRRLLAMAQDPQVHFIAVSKAIKARAIEYGIPESKLTVAYIGVNTEQFKPGGLPIDQRPPRILFVGRMVEKKAPLLMIRAFAEVRESVHDARLVMVGDGPLLEQAKKLSVEVGVPVDFLGSCGSDQVLEEMHQACVLCLPSIRAANGDDEGLPIVVLEALACGVPVVTSANGAVGEVVRDGLSGFTPASNAVGEFAVALVRLLSNDALRHDQRTGALRLATEEFSITLTVSRLEALYHRLVSAGGGGHAVLARPMCGRSNE